MQRLDYSQTRSFNFGIAKELSVEAALIYNDLAFAQESFGQGWFFRSYEQLMKRLPYSEKTLRRHVKKLADAGWVRTKIMKVNGSPVCHYQISRFLSDKMTETMETDKMTDSILTSNNKTIQKSPTAPTSSFGENNNSEPLPPASTARARALLPQLIEIVNPREKSTADRLRVLNGRLKDYSEEEILGAARAFSQSEWHRNNKQMSIDNLIAPSKFGRWYAQRTDVTSPQTPMRDENGDLILSQEEISRRLQEESDGS